MRMKVNKLDDGSLMITAIQDMANGEYAYARLPVSKDDAADLDIVAAASAACAINLASQFPSKFLGAKQIH